MTKTITIEVDDKNTVENTIDEVARLIRQGYTSGIDPTWDIVNN